MHGCWGEGVCVVAGGCAWLPGGMCGCGGVCMVWGVCMVAGGVHGCQGACMVAGGCAWLPGGHAWLWGACVVAGGHAWLLEGMYGCQGACMVAGGHGWLLGGVHGCWGGMCRIRRDTINEQAVRILLECILVVTCVHITVFRHHRSCSVKFIQKVVFDSPLCVHLYRVGVDPYRKVTLPSPCLFLFMQLLHQN